MTSLTRTHAVVYLPPESYDLRMNRILILLAMLVVGTLSADDTSVQDVVKFDLRAIGQTQGAGVPNAIGAGAFVPLHAPELDRRLFQPCL